MWKNAAPEHRAGREAQVELEPVCVNTDASGSPPPRRLDTTTARQSRAIIGLGLSGAYGGLGPCAARRLGK